MSNKCPYCGSFRNVCVSPVSFRYVCLTCEKFFRKGEQPKQTIFDCITQSPEVLAEKLVVKECNRYGGYSYKAILLVDENGNYRDFYSREKAHAATVAKLKEGCND